MNRSTILIKLLTKAALLFFVALPAYSAETGNAETDTFTYRPNFHVTIRPRFELSTQTGEHRFQMRNARAVLDGHVARQIDYFINIDLCDRGTMKILDVWGRLSFGHGFAVQAGQFRHPFGVETFLAPHQYLFANRSFMAKTMCNIRSVGVKGQWHHVTLPLLVEAGIFNRTAIGNHAVWNTGFGYSGKATLGLGDFSICGGFMSVKPGPTRINLADASVVWRHGRWRAGAEYMYKHYTHHAHKATHGHVIYGDYRFPIKAGIFNRMSVQARYDGMTAHSDGKTLEEGMLVTTDHGRQRLTGGVTITWLKTAQRFLDFRIDYEQYFHSSSTPRSAIGAEEGSRIVAEVVLRF